VKTSAVADGDDGDQETAKSVNENALSTLSHKAFASRFAQNLWWRLSWANY